MNAGTVEIMGTLREDGTLVLDQNPGLPPGRVKVHVCSQENYRETDFWRFIESIWEQQRSAGITPRSVEEIEAERTASRMEDEARLNALEAVHGGRSQPNHESGKAKPA
jgi:hypothetical protein